MSIESSQERMARIGGGIAGWSIRHPIGVVMLTLATIVLGLFSLGRLSVDLLPHIIYPEIRVRILDTGVPASIMEDRVTRQLEEQLAITEDAISVESRSREGRTDVDLAFKYGKDIDIALRDASTRLDRAKRFLPTTIDPPIIYKRDPSQRPVAEYVVSSNRRDSVELRTWVDDVLAKWFLNLPGVAAAEVGGGMVREIQVLPDQNRLAGLGLRTRDIINALEKGNQEQPAGRVKLQRRELSSRTSARFEHVDDINYLPIALPAGGFIYLHDIAKVVDTHEDERIRVRLNNTPGVKLSIQKQPNANTINVADVVRQRLVDLKAQGIIPDDIEVKIVGDQSVFVRNALNNAAVAAISGAVLAMVVVYLFLGNLKRTLIIGSAIPIAIMVTFMIMDMGNLTLNIMTLGGLAVGVGMLVDNTIVMLENIYRHQKDGEDSFEAGIHAAQEVNSAIIASTTTNLAAIIPFLFVSGLIGLLFRELIFTITAAIISSMIVAITLVPALATRIRNGKKKNRISWIDRFISFLQNYYEKSIDYLLQRTYLKLLLCVGLLLALVLCLPAFNADKQEFLPELDDGRIGIRITADPGIKLGVTDEIVRKLEQLIHQQPGVDSVFTLTGGFIFGRTETEARNKANIDIQLLPKSKRSISSKDWITNFRKALAKAEFTGVYIRVSKSGIPGARFYSGSDDISLRIKGSDLATLDLVGYEVMKKLRPIKGLQNLTHSAEESEQELSVRIDRKRAADLGFTADEISQAVRIAINGVVATEYLEGDRAFDILVRLPYIDTANLHSLESLLLGKATNNDNPIYLSDVARIELIQSPAQILRDNQQRIIEVSAKISSDSIQGEVLRKVDKALEDLSLPEGYSIYNAGISKTLQEGRQTTMGLLGLAMFLVLVVMAVQYESILNPLIILIGVPFAAIGVAIGIMVTGLPLSMPIWLGMIMLAGIVVNNAIVMVEYIEILRHRGMNRLDAITKAARLRLRPILMTSLTTMIGLLPLALGIGEGAEMLQPLAVTIIYGLGFSLLVSLYLIPVLYQIAHRETA